MGLKITLFMADFVKLLNHLILKIYRIYMYIQLKNEIPRELQHYSMYLSYTS